MDSGTLISYAIIVVISVYGLISIVLGLRRWHINNNEPQFSTKVQVYDVKEQKNRQRTKGYTINAQNIVTFRFIDTNEYKTFYVSRSQYGWLSRRDAGILVSQGTRFISFNKEPVTGIDGQEYKVTTDFLSTMSKL